MTDEIINLKYGLLVPANYVDNEQPRLYFGTSKLFGCADNSEEYYQLFINLDLLQDVKTAVLNDDLTDFKGWREIDGLGTRIKVPNKGGLMIERRIGNQKFSSRFTQEHLNKIIEHL